MTPEQLDELERVYMVVSGSHAVDEGEEWKDSADALYAAFPSLLALARDGVRYREMESRLRGFADAEYVRGINMASNNDACKGGEAKIASGTFGAKELKAHKQMNRHFGAHFGIYAAMKERT